MPFPHAVRRFTGRRAELDRVLAHADSEVLFFVYGLAGIGKTELVYQVVEELRARPKWAEATPVLVEIEPGSTAAQALAQMLSAVGVVSVSRRGRSQMARLAQRLEARQHLLVLDDVHHMSEDAASEILGYLSRHVQASRLFAISRRKLVLPADARLPVVTTLGPLDRDAAEQMMGALVERLQIPQPDPRWLMRTTHGSPSHIQRLLTRPEHETRSLESSLDELTPAALRLLRVLAIARQRPSFGDDTLRELTDRFFVDNAGELSDLVREMVLDRATTDELVDAHAHAAELCSRELADHPDAVRLAAAAVHHAMAAGRYADAWPIVERLHMSLAVIDGEDSLFETLARLREALPERRVAIDLLNARCLLRASRIEDATRVLEQHGDEEARYGIVAGDIAMAVGDRARAKDLFERADPMRRAMVSMLDGEGARTREQLADLPHATARERARVAYVRALSWMLDERYEEAAVEARRAALELPAREADDLANQLAMLESVAAVECDDMESARAAACRIDEAGLRRRVVAVHRAIVRYADGDAKGASEDLAAAAGELRERKDVLPAYLAGYYGSAALAESGNLGRAQMLAAQTSQLAERAGLPAMAARSIAQQAMFAAEAVQSGLAHSLAHAALAVPNVGPRSRAVAHCARARAYTLEGNTTHALEQIALAHAAVASTTARAAIDIEQAAVELVGGNLDRAVSSAERVVEQHRGRDYQLAHARLVLSAAYIARGRRTDLLLAEPTLAHARDLADRGKLRSIQVGCAILSAALARRGNRDRAAHDLLAGALQELDPERGSVYAGTLLAAIDGGAAARVIPGAVALLGHLGFTETVECYLIDARARRAATDKDVTRERTVRELFVDELRDVIVARHGEVEIRGRPMLCALLSVLVQAGGAPVTPETLYTRTWGVDEYHPLQHRNALYVAINRLRSSLREVMPERELIERASAGWRLAAGVDACAAVAVRPRAKTM